MSVYYLRIFRHMITLQYLGIHWKGSWFVACSAIKRIAFLKFSSRSSNFTDRGIMSFLFRGFDR